MDQPVAAPGLGIDIGHAMARGIHERLVLGVRDRRARDEEALQRLGHAPALAVVPAALPRSGMAVGRLVELIGVLPLGRVGARDEGASRNLHDLGRDRGFSVGSTRESGAREREAEGEQGSKQHHLRNLFTGSPIEESQKFERREFARHDAVADNSSRTLSSREAPHATLETPARRNGGPRGHRACGRHNRRPRHSRHIRRRESGGDPAASGPGRAPLRLLQPLRAMRPMQPVQSLRGGMRTLRALWAVQSLSRGRGSLQPLPRSVWWL